MNCGHGWHFGGPCVPCEHELEQVWIEPLTLRLVGPFRCRKCRIVKPEAVDAGATATGEGAPESAPKDCLS